MDFLRYGEDAIRIILGDAIDLETHRQVRQCHFFLKSLKLRQITDITPSFRSCLIRFDRNLTTYQAVISLLKEKQADMGVAEIPEPMVHEIPVMYGGEYGPNMEFVCSYSGLTGEQVIEIHTARVYTVFMVGFMPGFPYIGPLDRRLYAPRLDTPRLKVPEGSVGLAQLQAGIYPFESPGGWRIMGETDVRLFDPRAEPYSLMKIGDNVRFVSI